MDARHAWEGDPDGEVAREGPDVDEVDVLRHRWEDGVDDADAFPDPAEVSDGDDSVGEVPNAQDEFLAVMIQLLLGRETFTAKTFCTLMFWVSKGGSQGSPRMVSTQIPNLESFHSI